MFWNSYTPTYQFSSLYFSPLLDSHGDELTQEEIQEEAEKEFQEKKEKENQIDQEFGTGIHSEKDLMDVCENAAGPRPINKVFSPGRTTYATVDDVNGGFRPDEHRGGDSSASGFHYYGLTTR